MGKYRLVFAFGVTVAGTGLLWLYLHKRRVRNRAPVDNWKYVGTLEEIIMYPIKSCAGIELDEAKCGKYGLESDGLRDRLLITIDDDNFDGFAGRQPKMWQIKAEIVEEGSLLVTAPSMEPLLLQIPEMIKDRKEVAMSFEDVRVPLIECDAEYGSWFSKFLLEKDTGIRLFVCINPTRERKLFSKTESHYSYMVISDESVANLNARIPNKVHHWQFRGNFLISTHLPAFAEDNWKWIAIGHDATFRYKAPCYRCILPNINPFTSESSRDFEPLKTLKRFRMRPGQKEPEMGIYFDLHTEGVIRRGDPVFVIT